MRTEISIRGDYKHVEHFTDANVFKKIELFNLNDELLGVTTFYDNGKNVKTITLYMFGNAYVSEYNESGKLVFRKIEKVTK